MKCKLCNSHQNVVHGRYDTDFRGPVLSEPVLEGDVLDQGLPLVMYMNPDGQ